MTPTPFSRSKKQLNASMNVVPYIDVMLVLLVIFMVTTPMMTTGVDVDLPKAKTDSLSTGLQMPIIVSLKENGNLFISYEDNENTAITEDQLVKTLNNLQNQANGDQVKVMINADQGNQYGSIMKLMANLQQAGIERVGLLTAPPADLAGE